MTLKALGDGKLGICLTLVLLIAGFAGSAAVLADSGLLVGQKNRAFKLKEVDVQRGETVSFSNEDEFLHHVYVKSGSFNFDSGEQAPGKIVPIKFTEAGEFQVQCAIHPKMRLQVNVR